MLPVEIVSLLEQYISDEQRYYRYNEASGFWRWGWVQQRERLAAVALQCVAQWAGDLVEIGCQEGLTTQLFAEVARTDGRHVIAVDPWETGTPACEGGEYEKFLANIEPFKDSVEIVRLSSQSDGAREHLQPRQLCFAYVDGLHTAAACASDLKAVAHSRCIAVDDILWDGALLDAYMDFAKTRNHVRQPYCREGYIL